MGLQGRFESRMGKRPEAQRERQAFLDGHTLVRTQTNPQNIIDGQLQIVDLLSQLPSEQRRVAVLFYDGFTYEEIAEVLEKSEATVRSLLRHARERLRSQRRRLDH
jgi:RNA polymerase sigma factor (sigma-70 family)